MMKIRHIMPVAMLALPLLAGARPADPRPIKTVGPDGTEIEIRRVGDEHFSYVTNAEGTIILERDVKGFWSPAMRDGLELTVTPENIEMLYQSELQNRYGRSYAASTDRQRAIQLDSDGRTLFPTNSNDIHSLVVLLSFEDKDFTLENPIQQFTDVLNQKGYNKAGAIGSAADYFEKVSDGKFRPTFDIYPEVVKLPKTSEYYVGNKSGSKYDNWREALVYALAAIEKNVDFSKYDFDNDGFVDSVYFIYAGYGQADTALTNVIWPHESNLKDLNITYDGKKIGAYACSNELRGNSHVYVSGNNEITWADNTIDGIGAFCHEFGHVLGLPDLYRTDGGTANYTPFRWTVMDQGSYNGDSMVPPLYSAYERYLCRWLEYEIAEEGKTYTLKSMNEEPRGVRINTIRSNGAVSNGEYLILESRTKEGYDTYLEGEGLLIWHIDYNKSVWQNNQVNCKPERPRCTVVTPDGLVRNAAFPGFTGDYTFISADFKPLLTMQSATSNPKPVIPAYITDIAYDDQANTSTFGYNIIKSAPEFDCFLGPATLNDKRNAVILRWNPVAGVSDYFLTVTRFDPASQRDIVVAGYDELPVGNITKATVNLPANTKSQEYTAYVRPFMKVPAKNTSNIIRFIPDECVGINDVQAGASTELVFGGKGEITAPENAEIYTASGIRCGRTGLAAGIYIVRTEGKTTKVIVK